MRRILVSREHSTIARIAKSRRASEIGNVQGMTSTEGKLIQMPHRLCWQPDAAMHIAACVTPTILSALFRGEYNSILLAQSATNVGKQVLPTLLVYTIPWQRSLA